MVELKLDLKILLQILLQIQWVTFQNMKRMNTIEVNNLKEKGFLMNKKC